MLRGVQNSIGVKVVVNKAAAAILSVARNNWGSVIHHVQKSKCIHMYVYMEGSSFLLGTEQ